LKNYKADLHIHTCLSPCADWEMSPKRIAEVCEHKHIDIIAICDHNSAENAGAVMRAGKEKGICVLPGIEICSKEEVHILTLFEKLDQANIMQEYVYSHLKGENNPELFGYQVVALETDEVVCESPKMLIGAAQVGPLDAIEISSQMTTDEAKGKIQGIEKLPIIKSSDAHSPESIGRSYTIFLMIAPTFKELSLAIKGRDGRKVSA